METHPDRDQKPSILHELIYGKSQEQKNLEKRAQELRGKGLRNEITAGETDDEPAIFRSLKFGVHVVRRPDDPDCLRVSLGEVLDGRGLRYLVIRGDPSQAVGLLQRAARALEAVAAEADKEAGDE